eukprot:6160776-Ditylum_brightwellii.AAC.1
MASSCASGHTPNEVTSDQLCSHWVMAIKMQTIQGKFKSKKRRGEEEGIRDPSSNMHDCVDRDIGKVHGHGTGTSVPVAAYAIFGKPK